MNMFYLHTQHIMYAIMQSDSYDELDAFRRLNMEYK